MVALPFDYAITVRQPFASAIVAGVKDIENRVFRPSFPRWGERLGIHVSRSWPDDLEQVLAATRLLWPDMPPAGDLALLQGHVIGHVRLVCVSDPVFTSSRWAQRGRRIRHWHLADAVALAEPFVATGRLGVWRCPDGEYNG